MQIQVNTGKQIDGGENFNEYVSDEIEGALHRFAERITRVEVHFSDVNSSAKTTDDDKRCVLEARLSGMQPISVSDQADTVRQALDGALDKMKTTLGRTLDRLTETKGRPSYGDGPVAEE